MPNPPKTLSSSAFIPFNVFEGLYPIKTDLVYAQPDHRNNHFQGLYNSSATQLWAHKDIVPIVLLASLVCHQRYRWTLKLNDCLRPVEAQEKMTKYNYDPTLVSLPGNGAHPRGMAIDIQPLHHDGLVEMGTAYDHFASNLANNPAARNYTKFPSKSLFIICERRAALETAMRAAADALGQRILPLPQEWWDFRFEDGKRGRIKGATYWADYSPLRESELPAYMHVVNEPAPIPEDVSEGWKHYIEETDNLVRRLAWEWGIGRSRELSSRHAQYDIHPS